jgi:hypothetical protein
MAQRAEWFRCRSPRCSFRQKQQRPRARRALLQRTNVMHRHVALAALASPAFYGSAITPARALGHREAGRIASRQPRRPTLRRRKSAKRGVRSVSINAWCPRTRMCGRCFRSPLWQRQFGSHSFWSRRRQSLARQSPRHQRRTRAPPSRRPTRAKACRVGPLKATAAPAPISRTRRASHGLAQYDR